MGKSVMAKGKRCTLFLALILLGSRAWGQGEDPSETCLVCHDTLSEAEEGPEGVHPLDDCLMCHSGLDGFDFEEGDLHPIELTAPDCSACHDEPAEKLAGTPHEDMGLDCGSCHGGHNIQPAAVWREEGGLEACLMCHDEQAEAMAESVHAPFSDKDRRPYPGCLDCHQDIHQAGSESRSELDRKSCLTEACSACHEKDVADYLQSRHHELLAEGDDRAPSCLNCHGSHGITEHHETNLHVSQECESCHTDSRLSLHHEVGGNPPELACTVCHSGHRTSEAHVADRLFPTGGLQNCTYCHSTDQHQGADLAHDNRACSEALGKEVRCIDCHTFHWEVEGGEPVPGTSHQACENCHTEQGDDYAMSVHGRSRAAGNAESPYCTDCHGQRGQILKAEIEFANGAAVAHCEECHADEPLMFRFGVNPFAVSGFHDTYHGELYDVTNTGKDTAFANCADCHTAHAVLEPEDPMSTVSKDRLLETCRQCHEDAEAKFTTYVTHPRRPNTKQIEAAAAAAAVAGTPPRKPTPPRPGAEYSNPGMPISGDSALQALLHSADVFMKGLFFGVMAFFLLHTLLWFQKGVRQRYGPRRIYYRRFNALDRVLHVLVNISFLALAFTGLPQTFSHTWLGRWVLDHVMSIEQAQVIHYWAAAVTGLYFVLHLGQVAVRLKQRGWRKVLWGPDSLVPRLKDLKDFKEHMGWFLGRNAKPKFDRWTYWEKFDYLAVFWGVFVIGISGVIRWQEEWFGNVIGGGAVSIATTIHKEEALLATAFIFMVHFFNTHLRSEKFPMDVSIYTGLITEHELKEERPEQFERMLASGKLESFRVEGRSAATVWMSYLWGTIALTLGVFMLVMIVLGFLSH
jgi:cytochrome b subunit of formate dehydrogenase